MFLLTTLSSEENYKHIFERYTTLGSISVVSCITTAHQIKAFEFIGNRYMCIVYDFFLIFFFLIFFFFQTVQLFFCFFYVHIQHWLELEIAQRFHHEGSI